MRFTTIILIWICFVSNLGAQVIDTIAISNQINRIITKEDAAEFLREVWDTDQKYRGTRTNDSIDLVNLFNVSFYLNKFGYPTKQEFGELSVIPWHVYAHTANRKLKRVAFPIVWKAYLKREITEKDLRTYLLPSLSNCQKDLLYFEQTPFKILFADLNIEVLHKIPIAQMIEELKHSHLHHVFSVIAQWKSKDVNKESTLNNETTKIAFTGHRLELLQDENSKIYHRTTTTNSSEPRELKQLDKNEYIFMDCEKESLVVEGEFIQHWSGTKVLCEYKITEKFR